jgi:hypothetical protein
MVLFTVIYPQLQRPDNNWEALESLEEWILIGKDIAQENGKPQTTITLAPRAGGSVSACPPSLLSIIAAAIEKQRGELSSLKTFLYAY